MFRHEAVTASWRTIYPGMNAGATQNEGVIQNARATQNAGTIRDAGAIDWMRECRVMQVYQICILSFTATNILSPSFTLNAE